MSRLGDGFGVAGDPLIIGRLAVGYGCSEQDAGGSEVQRLSCDAFATGNQFGKLSYEAAQIWHRLGPTGEKRGQGWGRTDNRSFYAVFEILFLRHRLLNYQTPTPPSVCMRRLLKRIGSWEAHQEAIICINLVEDPPSVLTSAMDRLVKVQYCHGGWLVA